MSKNKLSKFQENLTFTCLKQPAFDDVFTSKYELAGRWASDFFRNSNPIVLELGCGYGEYTVALAKKFPNKNFIGVDIKGARIWKGAKTVTEEKIPNAAFVRTRVECINNIFEQGEISEIWLTFPDPQLKKNRANKRLTSPFFLSKYLMILRPNGVMHLKTDSLHLYEYTRSLLKENNLSVLYENSDIYKSNTGNDFLSIKTHYEELSLKFGVPIKYISWEMPSGDDGYEFRAPEFYGDIQEGTLDDDRPKPGKRMPFNDFMKIDIEENSGCCFGVVRAIEKAEEIISSDGAVSCLGELVHNAKEVKRLSQLGLSTISHDDIGNVNTKILIRAHGEPPATFKLIEDLQKECVDATCPVVKALQKKVREMWQEMKQVNGQLVIFGKKGHAEVVGLAGQTDGEATVIENEEDLSLLDYTRPIVIVSQTTQSVESYKNICNVIRKNAISTFDMYETICRSVANRAADLKKFASKYDVIIFVAGHNSSNGKALFEESKKTNPHTYLVDGPEEIDLNCFKNCHSIGICGATSTPKRQMDEIRDFLKSKVLMS